MNWTAPGHDGPGGKRTRLRPLRLRPCAASDVRRRHRARPTSSAPATWRRRVARGYRASVPALIFDLDGTLVDTVYAHVFAWQRALAERDMAAEAWRIHRRIGMSGGPFTRAVARELGGDGPARVDNLGACRSSCATTGQAIIRPAGRCGSSSPSTTGASTATRRSAETIPARPSTTTCRRPSASARGWRRWMGGSWASPASSTRGSGVRSNRSS
jgi:hypothetical protein